MAFDILSRGAVHHLTKQKGEIFVKKGMIAAAAILAVAAILSACGGKKKDEGASMPASDGKTSATAVYDSCGRARK